MTASLSVLQRADASHVSLEPYPHLVLPNALPPGLYAELAASFPSPDLLGINSGVNNIRWDYKAWKVARNRRVPQLWRDFIAYHASQAFFLEIAELFYEGIHQLYPARFPDKQKLLTARVGVRQLSEFHRSDVLMDAMISGNTPVTQANSVRTSHVDRGDKLFSGLFYMKPANYDAVGGDLTISRFREGNARASSHARFKGPYVDDTELDLVKTIAYDANLLVLFINSLDSVHGVTVRQPSRQSRLFVNLVGEIDPPLYEFSDGSGARYLPADARPSPVGWIDRLAPALRRMLV